MNLFDIHSEQELANITIALKALSDQNRFRIFAVLMTGDSCNCELNDTLGIQPNLLSHHLRVLSDAGLVTSRRDRLDARWIYYAVDREAVKKLKTWLGEFLDPMRIQARAVCGPEGQVLSASTDVELTSVD